MKSWNLSSRMLMSLPAMPNRIGVAAAALIACAVSPAMGQGFNVDFNNAFLVPGATYGAAGGQPGIWHNINAVALATPITLNGLTGVASGVTLTLTAGPVPGVFSSDNPLTAGDDQALMDDFFDLGAGGQTFTVSGLAAGRYDVFTYGWASDVSTFVTGVNVNGTGVQNVGGVWPAGHRWSVTYAYNSVTVTAGGGFTLVTTVVSGAGSLNGLQIVPAGSVAPPNDLCAGAFPIPPAGPFPLLMPTIGDITLAGTTGDPGIPSCQTSVSRSIWYTFTPTTGGPYTLSTCNPPTGTTVGDTVISVYTSTGGCAGPFVQIACADDNGPECTGTRASVTTGSLTAAQQVFIVIWQFSTGVPTPTTAQVQLRVTQAAPPPPGWDETAQGGGDAGNLPSTAQVPIGTGALGQITGITTATNVQDMYLINITNPAAFTATTCNATGYDSQLFLFRATGIGVLANDDTPLACASSTLRSHLTNTPVDGPGAGIVLGGGGAGLYYIAISGFASAPGADPISLGGDVFNQASFTEESGPDGAGGASPVIAWRAGGASGSYVITLTGCEFAFASQPALPNDLCANAAQIGDGITRGFTTLATHDGSSTCDTAVSSRDVWFKYTAAFAGNLKLNTCGSLIDTALAVFSSCGGTQLACNDDCGGSPCAGPSSCVSVLLSSGQTVIIRLSDKGIGLGGSYQLTAALAPANDDCAAPIALTCGVPVIGSLVNAVNDYQLSGSACYTGIGQVASLAVGRDVVYSFVAPSTGKYSFKAQNFLIAGGDLVLYVSNNQCPPGGFPAVITSCMAASNRNSLSAAFTASEEIMCLPLVGGQQVFVFVDENLVTVTGGSFLLEVTACNQEVEPNGTPATAMPFVQAVEESITPAADIDFFSIGSPAAGTRLFAGIFTLSGNAAGLNSQLRVTTATDTIEFDEDDGDTTPLGATASVVAGTPMTGAPSFLRVTHNLATGVAEPWRVYSVVQPSSAAAIPETEPNDLFTQANSNPLNYFSGTMATAADNDFYSFSAVAGDTIFMALDNDPTRTANPFNGNLALLDPTGTVVILSAIDANVTSSIVASPGTLTGLTPASPAEGIVFRVTTPGTYFARVNTTALLNTPDYLLSIAIIPNTCAPNAPSLATNDSCAAAQVIAMGDNVVGNTSFATHDGTASCDPGGLTSRDLWYSLTIAAGQIPSGQGVRFATCGSVIDTVLSVYTGTCGAPVEIGCNDNCGGTPCGGTASCITFPSGLAAGTYLVRVSDKGLGAGGRIRLNVSLTNDTCSDAIAVTANQSVFGTLAGAQNDYQLSPTSTCFAGTGQVITNAPGRDVAYSFTAPSNGSYSFRVLNVLSGGNLVIYIASGCLPVTPGLPTVVTNCLGAANRNAKTAGTTTVGSETAAEEVSCLPMLRGQTVIIIVDEVTATAVGGLFLLDVSRCTSEVEPNNTPATAGLVNNDVFAGTVPAADADFYALGSPTVGSRIFACAFGLTGNTSDFDLRVTTTTDTLEYDDGDGDTNNLGTFAPVIAGTIAPGGTNLFLRVNQFSSIAAEPYRLFSKIQPPSSAAIAETEPNDTIAQANSSPLNYFSGLMSSATDLDIFSFTALKGDIVFLGLDNDPTRTANPFNGNVELLDSTGAVLVASIDTNALSSTVASPATLTGTTPNSPAEAALFKIITTGTYFARVRTTALLNVPDYLLSIAITHDQNPPVISGCPGDILIGTDPGVCTAVVTWVPPTAQDDVQLQSFTSTHNPGATFLKGPTTVTYTAIDRAGNIATCSFVVTVFDDEPAVITNCPVNIFVSTDPGFCTAVVSWTGPIVTDNCPNDLVISSNHNPGEAFPFGPTTVNYTITDRSGIVQHCIFTVNVADNENPTITCPPAVSVPTDPGVCTATGVALGAPTVHDNCGVLSVTNNAPSSFPKGPTTVIWTVTDIHGHSAVCNQTVTVFDNQPPVITHCAVPQTVLTPIIPNLVPQVTATDNCPGPLVVTQSPLAGAAIVTTLTTVTLTVTDTSGLTATCAAVVTLFIPTQPTLSLTANPACGGLPADTIDVTLSMAHFCPLLASGFQAFIDYDPTKLAFTSGSYNLLVFGLPIITPITASGGHISLAAGINQIGGQLPVCADATLATLHFTVLVENCGPTPVVFRPVGPATVVSDPFGVPIAGVLLDVHAAVITLDGTPPIITCPGNITVNADAGGCTATLPLASLQPTSVTDVCDPAPILTFVRSDGALTVNAPFPCGVIVTVTWTATDHCGNFSSCSFTVFVNCVNQMVTNITLSPTMVAGPITRCITFQFFDCIGLGATANVVQLVSFTNGVATNVVVSVPCGAYVCVTARDKLHSLRRTVLPGINPAHQYTASFTGADQLTGGNLNDDTFIDILDFGVFVSQFPASYGSGSTTCATVAPHADINGDGVVGLPDFTYIQINFLQLADANCCVVGPIMAGGPLSRITLAELHRRGLGQLAVADLNNDGVLDQLDVAAFMGGAVPSGHYFIGAAPGSGTPDRNGAVALSTSWFDSTNWSAPAGLPDETSDVTLYTGVTIDQDGAVAGNLTVAEGGTLAITDGSLTVKTLTIESGGTLTISDPGSLLVAGAITIEPGATVIWHDGVIIGNVFNAGQLTLGSAAVNSLRLEGDYTQHAAGFLAIELGLAAGRTDAFTILGDASLGGSLNVSLVAGFFPQPGDSFRLIAAHAVDLGFDVVTVPLLGAGTVDASVSDSAVTLIVVSPSGIMGDLDGNGVVNSLDLSIILAAWGRCDPCAADLDHNGTVNNLDLGILLAQWQQ